MSNPTTLVPSRRTAALTGRGAGLTHAGRVRALNEDAILTDPTGVLWAVADGMGGHGHGDVASDIVIEHLATMPDDGDPHTMLAALLAAANDEIQAKSAAFGGDTMGATVVALMVAGGFAHIAWAGDSRAYLCRRGTIRLLTRDHSLVQDLVEQGVIDAASARSHGEANVITRAVGAEPALEVDQTRVPLTAGDRLVLCSDGLTGCLDDQTIADLVLRAPEPDAACRLLVAEALERGAPDNVSVIVIFVEER